MAKTSKPNAAPAAAAKAKVALALQGSFGHIVYAAGILDAFRAHNRSVRKTPGHRGAKAIDIAFASGCVEMLTPLWRYLAAPDGDQSLREMVVDDNFSEPLAAQVRVAPPAVRVDAWSSYLSGLLNAQGRWGAAWLKRTSTGSLRHDLARAIGPAADGEGGHCPGKRGAPGVELNAAWQDLCMYASGIPGQIAFNPLFVAAKEDELDQVCSADTGPTIFTNATRADDLSEIYLYRGSDPEPGQLAAMRGKTGKRQVLRLSPEYFFASGARPPYIAPVPVLVKGRRQHWMEGAMRCNPPLTPLIDMGATHIVLLRFFCKDAKEEPNNNAELNERFLDAVFNIPLQKEIESIEFNNQIARCGELMRSKNQVCEDLPRRSEVQLIDPGDRDNRGHCASYTDFLHDDLGTLSHYDGLSARRRAEMFERGVQIGNQLIHHLLPLLP
jgi:hypothetical protein